MQTVALERANNRNNLQQQQLRAMRDNPGENSEELQNCKKELEELKQKYLAEKTTLQEKLTEEIQKNKEADEVRKNYVEILKANHKHI